MSFRSVQVISDVVCMCDLDEDWSYCIIKNDHFMHIAFLQRDCTQFEPDLADVLYVRIDQK